MNDSDSEQGHAVALFRYGLIADLVQLQPGSKGLYALIAQKAASEYSIPGSTRTRVAEETIRDWLKAYRRGGFDALLPKHLAARENGPTYAHQSRPWICAVRCWLEGSVYGRGWVEGVLIR